MKIWLPTVKAGSGTDVYTLRLAALLEACHFQPEIAWFPHHFELHPWDLAKYDPPTGTKLIWTNSWNGFAFHRANIPHITTEHHCVFDPLYRPYKSFAQHLYHSQFIHRLEKITFSRVDAIVAVSQFTAQRLAELEGLRNVITMPNWIDTNKYRPIQKENLNKDNFCILYVGNLTRRKGYDLLIPILNLLGHGYEVRAIAGLRGKTNIYHPQITLLSNIDEYSLIKEYNNCDVLLCPSRYEGFGYTVLEAMSCGCPVVASNNSALPELIENRKNGYLCKTEDVDDFTKAIQQIKQDRLNSNQMGICAREKVENGYSVKSRINQICILIKDTIKNYSNR